MYFDITHRCINIGDGEKRHANNLKRFDLLRCVTGTYLTLPERMNGQVDDGGIRTHDVAADEIC